LCFLFLKGESIALRTVKSQRQVQAFHEVSIDRKRKPEKSLPRRRNWTQRRFQAADETPRPRQRRKYLHPPNVFV